MAGGKGDGDRSIGSRHILALFFGVVILCCIFFTLGFVMGRDQARGAATAARPAGASATEPNPPPGWSVSNPGASATVPPETSKPSGGPGPVSPKVQPVTAPPKKSSVASPAAEAHKQAATGKFAPPLIPRGAIVLQIAALTKNEDALAMAGALQERGFPAFVLTPTADNFFRVQVGPYADVKSADQVKQSLEHEGFKVIVRR